MVDITRLLHDAGQGRAGAREELARALYDELHGAARRQLLRERGDHTLQATALVHEAWLRLCPDAAPGFTDRAHFFAAAATAIRRVLTDHSRRRAADKRGGGRARLSLEDVEAAAAVRCEQLLDLDRALTRLAEFAPEPARLVELRFFAGLEVAEAAAALGVSVSTAERHWRLARAWLRGELEQDGDGR
ncbi:MAG: ECF-type sigma factor [Planctomycetota bacterium]